MGPDALAVAEGNRRFALDLYAKLRTEQAGNLFFSPSSLSTALAMTYGGARGETASQMAGSLHFTLPGDRLHAAFAALNDVWNSPEEAAGYRLRVANRLWGQSGLEFRQEFLALTRERYGAELARVDFAGDTERARLMINRWVDEQTEGKILDLVPAGALDALARLVLTNAVYFKGDWARPFDRGATADTPFFLGAGAQVDVPLMSRQDDLRYWAGDGLKALEMPYGPGDLSMVVLLPDEVDGLPALEGKLSAENLARWLSALRRRKVVVHLPRFRMTSQFLLNAPLEALGIRAAFSRAEADFSGMAERGGLSLGAVLHKAFVDVNEEGTEAAAATAVVMRATLARMPEPPATFRADHPFLFLIRDNRTDSLLFLGRLVDPSG